MTPPLVLWTARIAAGCWMARWVMDWSNRRGTRGVMSHVVWTAGCLVYLAHIWAAFELVHDWSHAAAVTHTAAQTRALTGIDWGGGVWFNYLFTLLWPLDAVWSWNEFLGVVADRPRWLTMAVQLYLALIVLNATLVFGPGWWWGIAAIAVMVAGIRGALMRR